MELRTALTTMLAKAIIGAQAADTVRGRVLDIAADAGRPAGHKARTLRNGFTDTWQGRESELASDGAALTEFRAAAEQCDREYLPIWAGEAVDLVTGIGLGERLRRTNRPAGRARDHRDGEHRRSAGCSALT